MNPEPLMTKTMTFADIDRAIAAPMEETPLTKSRKGLAALALSGSAAVLGAFLLILTAWQGIGLWGNNNPNMWAISIVNFVFWIGIAHAGTLISAILFLFRQPWRTPIARFAETMTVFALIVAALFPWLHTGRPWLAAYLLPYPTERRLWVNFLSPISWDVFAIGTYLVVSVLFWYLGLLPDIATLRDRTKSNGRKSIYRVLSLGWRFSHRHWHHYEAAYALLAVLATATVLSVCAIVSFNFAVTILPGWHSTIFPLYFIAGAIFSGFAMIVMVLVVLRKAFGLEQILTIGHLEKMNKIILTASLTVAYVYAIEILASWSSSSPFERFILLNRMIGPYAWAFWIMIGFCVAAPQLFWIKALRRSIPAMVVIAGFVTIGMWFERFVIIVVSLHRDFLPASWALYRPTAVDLGIVLGSFGIFFTLVLLFVKTLPTISIAELKATKENH